MTATTADGAGGVPARPYRLARLLVATALLIATLVAATTAMLTVAYQDALRQQETTLRNLAIAFSAQTASVVQAVDGAMELAARAAAPDEPGRPALAALARFGAHSLGPDYLVGIHVYDGDGRLAASGMPAGQPAPPPPSAA